MINRPPPHEQPVEPVGFLEMGSREYVNKTDPRAAIPLLDDDDGSILGICFPLSDAGRERCSG
jgi:hypothetical protein